VEALGLASAPAWHFIDSFDDIMHNEIVLRRSQTAADTYVGTVQALQQNGLVGEVLTLGGQYHQHVVSVRSPSPRASAGASSRAPPTTTRRSWCERPCTGT
jgi:hypothetical protein